MPRALAAPQRRALTQLTAAARTADEARQTRDRHVLDALAEGCPVAAVARAAEIDPATVRKLREHATA